MLRTVAKKVAWVGRPASMVFVLALALSSCGGGSQETKTPANSTPSKAFMKEDSDGAWQTWVANKDLSDQMISLGSPNNRRGAVLDGMRLVIRKNARGEVHSFVTDRHDLAAQEMLSLYRRRWQIELFFRWLKRQLGALRPLGYSSEAVWLTLVVSAIVAVLELLAEEWRPKGVTRVSWLRALGPALFRWPRFSG